MLRGNSLTRENRAIKHLELEHNLVPLGIGVASNDLKYVSGARNLP